MACSMGLFTPLGSNYGTKAKGRSEIVMRVVVCEFGGTVVDFASLTFHCGGETGNTKFCHGGIRT